MLAPIATLIVGLVAAFIAYQQYSIAHTKLKLDLFDRRYRIYEAARKFLALILQRATFDDKDLFEYYAGISDAKFLFPKEVTDYLKLISTRAVQMRTYARKYEHLPVGNERSALVDKESEELVWIGRQIIEFSSVFAPYMSFTNISSHSPFAHLERFIQKSSSNEI